MVIRMNDKSLDVIKVDVSQDFLEWVLDRLLSDMLHGRLPPELTKYLFMILRIHTTSINTG